MPGAPQSPQERWMPPESPGIQRWGSPGIQRCVSCGLFYQEEAAVSARRLEAAPAPQPTDGGSYSRPPQWKCPQRPAPGRTSPGKSCLSDTAATPSAHGAPCGFEFASNYCGARF
ncbi:unnamed protein product [Vitrella brassicaformis CCMP3155]|uniref:Uncharacterized protein n=1 Tax=Vitrella brassicaformis (strain CCMP3155) TaxID=1169540 RepID=A0A0G4GQJ9_VITBC|nr:unnamed protein product [Vitrella brassicaformis CCMP3155]|eukprot:CEM32504.1 unnamed protein product [Vitrella brassicaformis CCMP3155]